MSNEPEWKDANPSTENLPIKGKTVILFIAGGLGLLILTIVGMRIRPLGLTVGAMALINGIRMLALRHKYNLKTSLVVVASGFLLLLANPRFGIVAGFAAYFLIAGAVGLVIFGLIKAIKLAWDLGRWS